MNCFFLSPKGARPWLGGILVGLLLTLPASGADFNELRKIFTKGDAAYQQGDYPKAIEYYEAAVEVNPDFAPAYNALGLAHHANQEKLSNVVWFFNVALDIDPEFTDAYSNLCRVYYERELYDEAERACQKALEIDPDYGPAQLSLAWTYLIGKGQPAKAVEYFDEVLKKTQNPVVYFGRGVAYGQMGDTGRVIETITNLREVGSENLAIQLENSIRTSYMPATSPESLDIPRRQAGRIISSSPEATQQPLPAEESFAGTMRIRLRGKLKPTSIVQEEKTVTTTTFTHPGSLKRE